MEAVDHEEVLEEQEEQQLVGAGARTAAVPAARPPAEMNYGCASPRRNILTKSARSAKSAI